ncbi:MAG: ATP-binding cassette domain-containing protein [Lachnospiraceae bacterium]|nr:ATP-binding cassette domain-containing protein [Lachnospiraceae bacterium]
MNDRLKKFLILLIFILLWQAAAVLINNPIYFASPLETLAELINKCSDPVFWNSISGSMVRIICGFFSAVLAGYTGAFLSYKYPFIKDWLYPVVSFFKTVPVAAITVILLIWWGSEYLVLCLSIMVVFPGIYENMLKGLENTPSSLLELADVFRLDFFSRLLWIYRPAYLPYLYSALSVSLGMAFKSGVAAEIIGLPERSIGEQLYRDKIYLNTAGVFAWIITILILSSLTKALITLILNKTKNLPDPCPNSLGPAKKNLKMIREPGRLSALTLNDIKKDYDKHPLLNICYTFEAPKVYCITGPSGVGKTTLLNMIAGITPADSGNITPFWSSDKNDFPLSKQNKRNPKISMLFQDDRLIPDINILKNLEITGCPPNHIKAAVNTLIPKASLNLPVSRLSGGEKRRVQIIRAILNPSDLVIMDEPFTGLDIETKNRIVRWINNNLNNRLLIFSSHDPADITCFDDSVLITLENGSPITR